MVQWWPLLWVWVYGAAVYSCVDHHHCDHARVSTCPWTCCDLPPDTGATKIVVCAVHCYQCECCGEYVMWGLHYKLMDVQCSPHLKYFISLVCSVCYYRTSTDFCGTLIYVSPKSFLSWNYIICEICNGVFYGIPGSWKIIYGRQTCVFWENPWPWNVYLILFMIPRFMKAKSIFGPECFSTKLAWIGESFKMCFNVLL